MQLAKCGLNNEVNRLTVPLPLQVWFTAEFTVERCGVSILMGFHSTLTVALQYHYSSITVSLWFSHSISTSPITRERGPSIILLSYSDDRDTVSKP